MILHTMEQGTEDWFKAKLGVPSASNFSKIICRDRKDTEWVRSKSRTLYMYKLAAEIISGEHEDEYKNDNMEVGNDKESAARALYSLTTGKSIDQAGFCELDDHSAGCSPDGLVGKDGMIEIKSGIGSTQVARLNDEIIPKQYIQQVQGSLYVTGRKWCDFIAFHPKFKPLIIRATPDKLFHRILEEELTEFNAELQRLVIKIS